MNDKFNKLSVEKSRAWKDFIINHNDASYVRIDLAFKALEDAFKAGSEELIRATKIDLSKEINMDYENMAVIGAIVEKFTRVGKMAVILEIEEKQKEFLKGLEE